jgi:hypothetical protein
LFCVFIKSIQKIFEINRNLKQMKGIMKDPEISSSLNDLDAIRNTLLHALKRIDLVISELGQHRGLMLSYVETSRLKDGLKNLREINRCVKEMFNSLKLLLHEFESSSVK